MQFSNSASFGHVRHEYCQITAPVSCPHFSWKYPFITAPIEITCKLRVTKSSFSCLQSLWLFQHCHFLEVQDISDHSSETNIYGSYVSSEKMASEVKMRTEHVFSKFTKNQANINCQYFYFHSDSR